MITGIINRLFGVRSVITTRIVTGTHLTVPKEVPGFDVDSILRTVVKTSILPGSGSIGHPFFDQNYGIRQGKPQITAPDLSLATIISQSSTVETRRASAGILLRIRVRELSDALELCYIGDSELTAFIRTVEQYLQPDPNNPVPIIYRVPGYSAHPGGLSNAIANKIEPRISTAFFEFLIRERPQHKTYIEALQQTCFAETLAASGTLASDPTAHDALRTILTSTRITALNIDVDDITARFQVAGYPAPDLKTDQSTVEYFQAHPETLPVYLRINKAEGLIVDADMPTAGQCLIDCDTATTLLPLLGAIISRGSIKDGQKLGKFAQHAPQAICACLVAIEPELKPILADLQNFRAEPQYADAFREALCSRLMEYPNAMENLLSKLAHRPASAFAVSTTASKPTTPTL